MIVTAIIALIGGAVVGGSVEFAAYVFLGGVAGIIVVRRGERLQSSSRRRSRSQSSTRWSSRSSRCSAIATSAGAARARRGARRRVGGGLVPSRPLGSFVAPRQRSSASPPSFQLLELANPSQPLLRRLLLETPGTYHHSLMVGNLAERAAEAIGADPLVARVAAYYHDIGKLANPLAFIENQAGGENIHDELEPEQSARAAQAARRRAASTSRTQYKLPKADHRLHPAAPRHGADELLLRARPGAGGWPYGGARPEDAAAEAAAATVDAAPVPPRRPQAADPGRRRS